MFVIVILCHSCILFLTYPVQHRTLQVAGATGELSTTHSTGSGAVECGHDDMVVLRDRSTPWLGTARS